MTKQKEKIQNLIGDYELSCNLIVEAFAKKQGLKILSCGSGIESQDKQKRSKALPLGESMTSEAHPIALRGWVVHSVKHYQVFLNHKMIFEVRTTENYFTGDKIKVDEQTYLITSSSWPLGEGKPTKLWVEKINQDILALFGEKPAGT